jgi:RimJ/RimL family protein N-acetyltransferase
MNKVILFPEYKNEAIVKPFLYDLYSDKKLATTYFNNITRPNNETEARQYVDDILSWQAYKGYIILYEGIMVGEVGYLANSPNPLNVVIREQFQGKGIAKEAIKQIMALYPNKTFTATILSDNIASISLFKSLGFVKTGRDDYYQLDIYEYNYEL